MNELTKNPETAVSNKLETFTNKTLNGFCKKLDSATKATGKAIFRCASILGQIEKTGCYSDDGFKNATDFACRVYGYKKSMANNLVRVGSMFIKSADDTVSILGNENNDFTVSKLIVMLPLKSADVAKELVENGEITYSMTEKEIKEVVDQYKPEKKSKNESTGEGEVEETPEENEVMDFVREIRLTVDEIEAITNAIVKAGYTEHNSSANLISAMKTLLSELPEEGENEETEGENE